MQVGDYVIVSAPRRDYPYGCRSERIWKILAIDDTDKIIKLTCLHFKLNYPNVPGWWFNSEYISSLDLFSILEIGEEEWQNFDISFLKRILALSS